MQTLEDRPILRTSYEPSTRPGPSAEQILNDKARALPDADFADAPEVVAATAEVALWTGRLAKLNACGARRYLSQADTIQSELVKARETRRWACLDCFLAKDDDYVGAWLAQERVQLLEQRLLAAQVVRKDLDRGVYLHEELADRVRDANRDLGDAKLKLKRLALLAQGEA